VWWTSLQVGHELFWDNLEAHGFHCFLTDFPTEQSVNSENNELSDSSKTAKTVKTALCSQSLCQTATLLLCILYEL
jgi:hypothetical protein